MMDGGKKPEVKIIREGNDHSFTLSSNGYRLVATESSKKLPREYPYSCRFGIVSFDGRGDYARMGIGKAGRNESTSFLDGIERQMVCLQGERQNAMEKIEELRRKIEAIDGFLEVLPKIFIDDGVWKDRER